MIAKLTCLAILLAFVSVEGQNIVLLGDSLSDNGNGYAAFVKLVLQTNQTYPQSPYYNGRWSNGPTWIEIAATDLGVNLTDLGAGGATSGAAPAQVPPLQPPFAGLTLPTTVLSPNLYQQVNQLLLANSNSLSSAPYYFIEIGPNDALANVFANATVTANQTFANIQATVTSLYNHGARKFVLVLPPTLSMLPVFTQPSVYGFYTNASINGTTTFINSLNSLIQSFAMAIPSTYSGATATVFDFGAALMQLVANAQSYGLTDTMQACYITAPNLATNDVPSAQPIGAAGGQLCSNPDNHLFWDQFHPTRVAHEFIGASFVQQLGPTLFGSSGNAPAPSAPAPGLPTLPYLSVASAGK